MIRIYFDKNIFSFLKKNEEPKYQKLNKDLAKYSNNLLYCFSNAHLQDLLNDKTEKKYEDLEFMESFVGNNYLCHNLGEIQGNSYLATPKEAFESLIENQNPISLWELFNNVFDDPELDMSEIKEILLNKKLIDLSSFDLSKYSEQDMKMIEKLIPTDKSNITLGDMIQKFSLLYENFVQNQGGFKDMRGYIINGLMLEQYNIDYNSINFNEDLKNTIVGKTFIDFVSDSLDPNKENKIARDNFFITAFVALNILGIDKEANSKKKARFNNTSNDALHGYYGAYCNYVISDDKGFLIKCKLIYKLLGIDTHVMHIDEFCSYIYKIGTHEEIDLSSFISLLKWDLKNGIVIGTRHSLNSNNKIRTVKTGHIYLSYFNRINIKVSKDLQRFIYLSKHNDFYSSFTLFKEYEVIVNKAVKLFGEDINFKGIYSGIDTKQINSETWVGRKWLIEQMVFILKIDEPTGNLILIIGPLNETFKSL